MGLTESLKFGILTLSRSSKALNCSDIAERRQTLCHSTVDRIVTLRRVFSAVTSNRHLVGFPAPRCRHHHTAESHEPSACVSRDVGLIRVQWQISVRFLSPQPPIESAHDIPRSLIQNVRDCNPPSLAQRLSNASKHVAGFKRDWECEFPWVQPECVWKVRPKIWGQN